jgi:hypothetical protein
MYFTSKGDFRLFITGMLDAGSKSEQELQAIVAKTPPSPYYLSCICYKINNELL